MSVVDWTDPCARAAALRNAYFSLVSGGSESTIRQRGPDTEQEVRFHKSDLSTLRTEMQAAEDACLVAQGMKPVVRRFAITAGSRRLPTIRDIG